MQGMVFRSLPLLAALLLGACADQSALPPARSTGLPFPVNDQELETPNSLPRGFTTNHPMAPATGVIGVTHTGS